MENGKKKYVINAYSRNQLRLVNTSWAVLCCGQRQLRLNFYGDEEEENKISGNNCLLIPALGWVQVCPGAKDDQNNLQNTLLNFLLLIATFEMEVYKQKFVIVD